MTDPILVRDPVLAEIVRRLVEAYQPERVYLFGSKAREDAGPDSDYDLLIVVSDNAPAERCNSDLGYRALRGTGIGADIVVWKRSDFERRKHVVCSLPATVVREGRLLHAA
jgi:predicted nucleotidyltransferase